MDSNSTNVIHRCGEGSIDDVLRFGLNLLEVFRAQETLGVDFVDRFGAGRSGSKPAILGHHLEAADGCIIAGRIGQFGEDRFSRHLIGLDHLRRERFQHSFLLQRGGGIHSSINGAAELLLQRLIMLAGVSSGLGRDFGGQQVEDDAILVGRPHRAIHAQEAGSGAFLAAETVAAVEQAIHKPLEAHRHLRERASQVRRHPVDHRTGDQGFADSSIGSPARSILEQVIDGDRQIVVGIHQSHATRDDAVTVVVGVIAKGDVELVFEVDEAGHGVGRRAIHADLAILVHGHETKGGIDIGIHHLQTDVRTSRRWAPSS